MKQHGRDASGETRRGGGGLPKFNYGESKSLIDELDGADVLDVGSRLGLEVLGRSLAPCPSCGAARRGSSDKRRGPISVFGEGTHWACKRGDCSAKGDALDLASYIVGRARFGDLQPYERDEVRRSLLGDDVPPVRRVETRHQVSRPNYMPAGLVEAVWNDLCTPISERPQVAEHLQLKRNIDPLAVEHWDLARALRIDADCRPWGARWPRDYPLVLPTYDHIGKRRGLHARAVDAVEGTKARFPRGYTGSGLVLADPVGLEILRRGDWPEGLGRPERTDVVICEGVPDYLTWAATFGDACEAPPAVYGVGSGWWKQQHADRIPDGLRIVCRAHRDDNGAGLRLMEAVADTFGGRCPVTIVVIGGGHDGN